MTKQKSQESKATTKKEYCCPLILAAQPGAALARFAECDVPRARDLTDGYVAFLAYDSTDAIGSTGLDNPFPRELPWPANGRQGAIGKARAHTQ